MGRVVVDTDTGVDDALALFLLLREPGTEVVAVVSAAGNCAAEQAARNAAAVCAAAGRPGVPVHVGVEPAGKCYVGSPHGPDGLGGTGFGAAYAPLPGMAGPEAIVAGARADTDLLCLAPLTNVAAALCLDPLVLARYRSVVVMGGMGLRGRAPQVLESLPQFLSKGDTNTDHDPEAAAAVAAAAGEVVWVGMDATSRLRVPYRLARESATAAGRFVAAVTGGYARHVSRSLGAAELVFTAHDSVAATVLADPGAVLASALGSGAVERGRDGRWALWAREGGPHRFVTEVDHGRVLLRVAGVLGAGGGA